MTIKKRLKISYVLMLLVPILLIFLAGSIYSHSFGKTILPKPDHKLLDRIYKTILTNPDSLLEMETLYSLKEISEFEGIVEIVVEKPYIKNLSTLPDYDHDKIDRGPSLRNEFDNSWEFYFSDGSYGEISVLLYNSNGSEIKSHLKIFPTLFIIFILVMTNGLLSYIISKSIVSPLNRLKLAAVRIKDEDLNTKVVYSGDDEFKEVFNAFEEMRQRLKDSLKEQIKDEENRKALLANISHDLKTPITAIRGYIDGIKDGVADTKEKQMKYIETIYSKSILMNNLIDQLFLYSKLDMDQVTFNFESVPFKAFITDLINELSYDYPQMDMNLDIKEEINVVADNMQLHRVITNIVENANKYNDSEKPELSIKSSYDNNYIEVSFNDNGRGLKEDELNLVFERFYRSDPARSSQKDGAGLGLAISKQIINAHGGTIKAESKYGSGTTITITLKRAF